MSERNKIKLTMVTNVDRKGITNYTREFQRRFNTGMRGTFNQLGTQAATALNPKRIGQQIGQSFGRAANTAMAGVKGKLAILASVIAILTAGMRATRQGIDRLNTLLGANEAAITAQRMGTSTDNLINARMAFTAAGIDVNRFENAINYMQTDENNQLAFRDGRIAQFAGDDQLANLLNLLADERFSDADIAGATRLRAGDVRALRADILNGNIGAAIINNAPFASQAGSAIESLSTLEAQVAGRIMQDDLRTLVNNYEEARYIITRREQDNRNLNRRVDNLTVDSMQLLNEMSDNIARINDYLQRFFNLFTNFTLFLNPIIEKIGSALTAGKDAVISVYESYANSSWVRWWTDNVHNPIANFINGGRSD